MSEFKINKFRYTWRGNWVTNVLYKKDDVIKYGGGSWVCVRGHTSAGNFYTDLNFTFPGDTSPSPAWEKMTDGYVWKDAWQDSTLYNIGDIVSYGGALYLCILSYTSTSTFDDNISNWITYSDQNKFRQDWQSDTRYGIGDVVRYNGIVYRCIEGHTSDGIDFTINTDINKWEILFENIQYRGSWQSSVVYRVNDLVKFGGTVWRCKKEHETAIDSTIFFDIEENWLIEFPGFKFQAIGEDSTVLSGDWNIDVTYRPGDVVRHGGYLYYSLTVNQGSAPGGSNIYQIDEREDPPDWEVLTRGVNFKGIWNSSLSYKTGDVVHRGGNLYVALLDTTADGSSLDYLDASNWELLVEGHNFRGNWDQNNFYVVGDIVKFIGNTYRANYSHYSSSQNYPGDNGSGFDYWDLVLQAGPNIGMTQRGDLLTYDLSRGLAGDTSTFGTTSVPIGESGTIVVVEDGSVTYKNWGAKERFFYVATDGVDDPNDSQRGINPFRPYRTVRFACERADDGFTGFTTVKVSTGVFEEVLPIIVPARTVVLGDELRSTTVQPKLANPRLAIDPKYTIQGLTRLFQILEGVITGAPVEKTPGNPLDVVQLFTDTDPPQQITGGGDSANFSRQMVQDIIAYINFYINSTGLVPTLSGSNTATTFQNRLNAITILEANKEFLAEEAVARVIELNSTTVTDIFGSTEVIRVDDASWMEEHLPVVFSGNVRGGIQAGRVYYIHSVIDSSSFTIMENIGDLAPLNLTNVIDSSFTVSFSFDSDQCKRDVRRYVEAIQYDLTYPGNYKSLLAARYYRNAVLGSQGEDMFYVRDATGVRDCTLKGLTGALNPPNVFNLYRTPTGGSYVSLDPGWGPADERCWILNRSPYIQGVTTLGTGCIGQKIDGALHNGGNRSIVSNDFTQVLSDGIGAWVANGGRAELVSVFTYYCHVGYLAANGGIIRATNGNCSYGRFGAVADGVDDTETPATAVVNNRNQNAIVASAFSGEFVDEIQVLEWRTAGQNYTQASATITGSGINAQVVFEDFRDDAIFQASLLDRTPESITQSLGGSGYSIVQNNAQVSTVSSIDLTGITIASNDTNAPSDYIGKRIIIISGTGTGQYAYITGYNTTSKVVTVARESDDVPGWDHLVPGTPPKIPLDTSTVYRIEPRVIFSEPEYSSTLYNLPDTTTWRSIVYGETTETYTNVAASLGTGSVVPDDGLIPTPARFTVTRIGRSYTSVTLTNAGAGYAEGDVISILGSLLGGVVPDNNIIITVTATTEDSTNAIVSFDREGSATSGKFVAIANGTNEAAYSSNGELWNAATMPSSANWIDVAAGNNRFVAISRGTNAAASSLDGINWTARTMPSSRNWESVVYGNDRFVAVASSGNNFRSAYSTNGTTWTQVSMPVIGDSTFNDWVDVTYGKNLFVAVANTQNIAAYSSNGISWNAVIMDVIDDSSQRDWVSVAYGNNRFVAISSQGDIAYSFDAQTWLPGTMISQDGSTAHNWKKIRYANGLFFAVGDTGQRNVGGDPTFLTSSFAATSPDGIAWTGRELSSSEEWVDIAYGNPFVQVEDSTLGKNTPMWVALGTSTNNVSKVRVGRRAQGRVTVGSGVIGELRIFDCGSGYSDQPTVTLVDPNFSTAALFDIRVGDGVLAEPSWINRGVGYRTATTRVTITGDGFADIRPVGKFVTMTGIARYPGPGAQITFNGNDQIYTIVTIQELGGDNGNLSAAFRVSPELKVKDFLEHGTTAEIRSRYSQCRITGHDFLDIGTGNFEETNYPELYSTLFLSAPEDEIREEQGGRVFYTSTDQSGNFRCGELFAVEQATGIVTISADFFDFSGLTELRLGGIRVGGTGAVIREFSTDPLFTEDSNNIVPTQRSISRYLANRLSVGGAEIATSSFIAGTILVGPNRINSTIGGTILFPVRCDFQGPDAGIRGTMLAQNMFHRSFGRS
jgi:hypothetical protein